MDNKTVFTKTAKGLGEALGKTRALPRDLRNILKEIDGKTSLEALQDKVSKLPEAKLREALNRLSAEDYIREFTSPSLGENTRALDFTTIAPVRRTAEPVHRRSGDAGHKQARVAGQAEAEAELPPNTEMQAQKDFEEWTRLQAEEQARRSAQVKANKDADEKQRGDAEAQLKKELEEWARAEAQEQGPPNTEQKFGQDAEAQAQKAAAEQARRVAEEKARQQAALQAKKEAEERARHDAQDQARREAELEAQRQGEQTARQEAEARARKEAEERARREAEEQARREEEEKSRRAAQARRDAEEKARREAEAKAKQEAEEEARREAEEARHNAEARAKEEAEEQARQEAGEQARREAEERARQEAKQEAEQRARQAEEQAQREAEEKSRREAEERARKYAEESARRAAEMQAQKEAEEQARHEVEEQARRQAKEQARREAEAEQKSRREAQQHARKEAVEEARRKAEQARQQAKQELQRNAEAQAKKEAEEWVRREVEERDRRITEEQAMLQAEGPTKWDGAIDTQGKAEPAEEETELDAEDHDEPEQMAPIEMGKEVYRKPVKWGKPVALILFFVIATGLVLIHLISFDDRIAQFEKTAAEQFQQPVKINQLHLSLLPQPHWRLDGVSIGKEGQIKAPKVAAMAGFDTLFGDKLVFKSVEFTSPVVSEEGLSWIMFGKARGGNVRFDRVIATNARLDSQHIGLSGIDATADFGADGAWGKIVINSAEKKVHIELLPKGEAVQIEFIADTFTVPFGSTLTLEKFSATGIAHRNQLSVTKFQGSIRDGILSGNARLKRDAAWSLDGELNATQIDPAKLVPQLLESGKLDGNAKYSMEARDADKLFAMLRVEGSLAVRNGTLLGVDLVNLFRGANSGRRSSFNELAGSFIHENGKTQLRKVNLSAGLLSARGNIDVDANKLDGRFIVEFKSATLQSHANLAVLGTLSEPRFSR